MEGIVAENQTIWDKNYEKYVIDVLRRGKTGRSLPRDDYNILNVYSLVSIGSVTKVTKRNGKYMATKEEVINVIFSMHIATGHGGEKKTHKKIQDKFANIPRYLVQEYIKRCERCAEKRRRRETASGVVIHPLTVKDLNERGQVDLVDMQTNKDGNYRFILHYIEYLTKFHVIRPLQRKTATEVANQLLLIFLDFGAPHILQSDNGREFTGQVIHELSTLWPELILVNGRPRHPQSQGSVERSNGDMKNQLMAWMRDNNTSKWSYGIRFVQWSMNTSFHETIGMEPYKALTGNKPRCGLKSILPTDFLDKIGTGILEEDLELQICEVENGDINSNNPETIVSPGDGNLDDESTHSLPMAPTSLDDETAHLLPMAPTSLDDETAHLLPMDPTSLDDETAHLLPMAPTSLDDETAHLLPMAPTSLDDETAHLLPMAPTSLDDETAHLLPANTTALDHNSAEAIFGDIIQEKDPELHHKTVSNSQHSGLSGNESHPAKRARIEACKGIEKQAKKMIARSTCTLRPLRIGDSVAVPVSQFDRSKGDPPNIIGLVLEFDQRGYRIGTRSAKIRGRLARNQIEFIKFTGMKLEDIPDGELSIREIVRAQSICGGQGFRRCHCKSNCLTKRCSCLKAGLKCNSACHGKGSCDNID